MGSALVQAYHWRLACFALAAGLAIQTVGIIYLGSLPKAVTHVVQVDRLGGARYFGPAASAAYRPGPESIKYYLRQFVHHTRSLTSDAEVLKTWWVVAYKFVTPAASSPLTTYVQANSPFSRAQEQRVAVPPIGWLTRSYNGSGLVRSSLSRQPGGQRGPLRGSGHPRGHPVRDE